MKVNLCRHIKTNDIAPPGRTVEIEDVANDYSCLRESEHEERSVSG